jgi:hypothetical protein
MVLQSTCNVLHPTLPNRVQVEGALQLRVVYFAASMQKICNGFANVWKCICPGNLHRICLCFAMHSPGLRKAFARSLLPCRKARAPRVKIPQVISHVFATCLPRVENVFYVSSCNAYVKVSQYTHQVFAIHSPGLRNTLTRSSQGVCQELVTESTARATRVERSSSENSCK